MDSSNILIFFEAAIFSFFVLAWASWEFFSVSRLQKKAREDEAEAATNKADGAD